MSELPGEALVYDFTAHHAHCMNDLSFRVFRRCDGKTSIREITALVGAELGGPIDEAIVWDALGQLGRAGLLVEAVRPQVNLSRRRALRKLALTAGLSVALPMVWSIVAPSVAEAASVSCPEVCTMDSVSNQCMGSGTNCCGTSGGTAFQCSSFAINCSGNTCS